jgi:hypothetical protein
MSGVGHFVLGDCVLRALATRVRKQLPVDVGIATSLREVNCRDCRRQIEQIAGSWLTQYQTRLTPMQDAVRRNADTIKYQLALINRLQKVIEGSATDVPKHSHQGDRCPSCARGALEPRRFRGRLMLACDGFPGCDYAAPWTGLHRA